MNIVFLFLQGKSLIRRILVKHMLYKMQLDDTYVSDTSDDTKSSNIWLHIKLNIATRWPPSQDLTGDQSTLVQVMAWCHQATIH